MAKTETPELPEIADFTGVTARIQNIADWIETAQLELLSKENQRRLNGHDDNDVVSDRPGAPTYAEHRERFTAGIRAIMEANADIPDLAERLTGEAVKRRDAREIAHRQDDLVRRYASTPGP